MSGTRTPYLVPIVYTSGLYVWKGRDTGWRYVARRSETGKGWLAEVEHDDRPLRSETLPDLNTVRRVFRVYEITRGEHWDHP